MKIGIIGYGKMGKTIEQVAIKRGHEIAFIADKDTIDSLKKEDFQKADVAIEFTSPHAVIANIKKCFENEVPVVVGSTGWYDQVNEIREACQAGKHSFLYASNFSIGVNIFFEINKRLAALMNQHKEYEISLKEIHHTQKKDAPSGTAISLAEQILEQIGRKEKWVNEKPMQANELSIISERIDPAPGTHHVKYSSAIDDIEIIHTAHNRTGFALGAVLAAEFLKGKQGFFGMKEVLNL